MERGGRGRMRGGRGRMRGKGGREGEEGGMIISATTTSTNKHTCKRQNDNTVNREIFIVKNFVLAGDYEN